MNSSALKSNTSFKKLFTEVRLLRRDVSLLFPADSLSHYKNKSIIVRAFSRAQKKNPSRV